MAITPADRAAIEATCRPIRDDLGPGPYNRCLTQEIEDLRSNPAPTFDGIAADDRRAIETVCQGTFVALGPGPRNRCLAQGIRDLRENPAPTFPGEAPGNRPSIQADTSKTPSGLGIGRDPGAGSDTGGGVQPNYPPTPTEMFIPPLPYPDQVRGFHLVAEYDVDETGKVVDFTFTPTRDESYNRRLDEALKNFMFRPGTKPDGTPVRMKAQIIYDF